MMEQVGTQELKTLMTRDQAKTLGTWEQSQKLRMEMLMDQVRRMVWMPLKTLQQAKNPREGCSLQP